MQIQVRILDASAANVKAKYTRIVVVNKDVYPVMLCRTLSLQLSSLGRCTYIRG